MPESLPSLPEVRCGALDEYIYRNRAALETKCRAKTSPIGITKPRGRRARSAANPSTTDAPSRKPGSSIYYGVRFRPDLSKWVAEIRVAQWKAVDKKVWLGTFDTERGAARGVDLARKLLQCQKKHGFNLPCPELDAYQGQIPEHLILTDVTVSHMFKAATLFIKRECQEYAAKFVLEHDLSLPQIASASHANSFESEIVDELGADSDHESCLLWPDPSISVNDYLNDDYPSSCTSVVSFTSAATSFTSNASFEHFLQEQQCLEMADVMGGVSFGEFGDAVCAMEVPGGVQGPVSQECSTDVVQGSWPGSSSELAPLPGSYCETIPYMPYLDAAGMDSGMDCDDFQNFHNYPFQHGFMRWN